MDELAKKMGKDPFEIRELNCYREGSTTPTQQKPEVIVFPEQFEVLRPKYQRAVDNGETANAPTPRSAASASPSASTAAVSTARTHPEYWAELLPNNEVMVGN